MIKTNKIQIRHQLDENNAPTNTKYVVWLEVISADGKKMVIEKSPENSLNSAISLYGHEHTYSMSMDKLFILFLNHGVVNRIKPKS